MQTARQKIRSAAGAGGTVNLKPVLPDVHGVAKGTDDADVSTFITYRLNLLYRLLDRQTKKMLTDNFGLTIAEWRVLSNLARQSPLTVGDISRKTYIAKSQVSRASALLVTKGLLLRGVRNDDARKAELSITRKGVGMRNRVLRASARRQAELLEQIDPADRLQFFAALDALTDYLKHDT